MNTKPILFVTVTILLLLWHPAYALDVYESTLSKNAICVSLNDSEVSFAKQSRKNSTILGRATATQVLSLAGVPESVTGKVASVAVWSVLCNKYSKAIYKYSKKTSDGSNLTLKFYGVNLEAVRKIWSASSLADHAMPGSELTKALISTLNEFINASLR